MLGQEYLVLFFFFNDTATTEIYTLSLHDALPICPAARPGLAAQCARCLGPRGDGGAGACAALGHQLRSEEHTSELQSQSNLVCRLLLEKKKKGEEPLWLRLSLTAGRDPVSGGVSH